jgi:hypothetical protein
MMPHETSGQKRTIRRVLREYTDGRLKIGRTSKRVRDSKQAIAIALSEAGISRRTTHG